MHLAEATHSPVASIPGRFGVTGKDLSNNGNMISASLLNLDRSRETNYT